MTDALGALVATSLSPTMRRTDGRGCEVGASVQRTALASLRAAFGEVVAFNFTEELAGLARDYPMARLVDVGSKDRAPFARPLVDFAHVWTFFERSEHTILALTNSDVFFVADPASVAGAIAAAHDGLVAYHRTETSNLHAPNGPTFRVGYDLFLFHRRLLQTVRLDGLAFGVPWWDYALPVMAARAGVPILLGDSSSVRHLTHEVAWSRELWRDGLAAYMRLLEAQSARLGRSDPLLDPLAGLVRRFAERREVEPLFGADQIYQVATTLALWNVAVVNDVAVPL